jgi:hypothetical protein
LVIDLPKCPPTGKLLALERQALDELVEFPLRRCESGGAANNPDQSSARFGQRIVK